MLTEQEKNYIISRAHSDVFSKSASSLFRGHPLADRLMDNISTIGRATWDDAKGKMPSLAHLEHRNVGIGAGVLAAAGGLYGAHKLIYGAKKKMDLMKYAPHAAAAVGGVLAAKAIGSAFSSRDNNQPQYGY